MKASRNEAAERLLIEAAQKDLSRFAELYEDNFGRVYAYIARRVRDRDQAQDLTADVFHRALANLARFEWRGLPFAGWLLKIAANLIADRSRRAVRERAVREPVDPPEVGLDEIEPRARLFKLVDSLPLAQRRVVLLRFAGERTIREIARDLGRSEGAIKQLQLRALQNLRARLGKANG